jgi:hypothetical protein
MSSTLFIKGLVNHFSVGRKYSKNIRSDFGIAPLKILISSLSLLFFKKLFNVCNTITSSQKEYFYVINKETQEKLQLYQ